LALTAQVHSLTLFAIGPEWPRQLFAVLHMEKVRISLAPARGQPEFPRFGAEGAA
jgi:hypothetical protein